MVTTYPAQTISSVYYSNQERYTKDILSDSKLSPNDEIVNCAIFLTVFSRKDQTSNELKDFRNKYMSLKIENKASIKIPGNLETMVHSILQVIPREHMRGLQRIVFVDHISLDSRLSALAGNNNLPGLYHPKQGITAPWLEVAVGTLLPTDSLFKRLAARLNFKANLAYLLISLQAQHYFLTLAHGIKKNQYEGKIKSYSDKYHEIWRESQSGWRAKLFKPLRPLMEKWAQSLKRKYEAEQKRQ